jgi:L-seryl-tRNA(Ser) seleniumtransferase
LRIARLSPDNLSVAGKARKKNAPTNTSVERATAALRAIPPVDECLRRAANRPALEGFSRAYLKATISKVQERMRAAIAAGGHALPHDRDALSDAILDETELAILDDRPALRPVVNASGVVLHTNLGRALLAEQAIEAVEQAARSAVNLEYDLAEGTRGDRDSLVERELCALTGAEAATVVNNNAAAVLLVLNSLARGKEVVVSRGELIEIGGSFRIPDVMERSGAILKEVGTTNRTHPRDYEAAIGPDTALLLKVHPSNYRIVGFASEVSLPAMAEIGRKHGVAVLEDLGSGALVDLSGYGLAREPIVAERISAGADLVTFSGDKLLGGPQAGIVVGRRDLVAKLKANPLKRALRCGKLTLAALEATLRIYLRSADLGAELPALRMLRRTTGELGAMAPRARDILCERLGPKFSVEVVESTSQVGSGALPVEELSTIALRVTHPAMSPDAIARFFRSANPPVIGRIKADAFHLDLRTVEDASMLAVEFTKRRS